MPTTKRTSRSPAGPKTTSVTAMDKMNGPVNRAIFILLRDIDDSKHASSDTDYKYQYRDSRLLSLSLLIRQYRLQDKERKTTLRELTPEKLLNKLEQLLRPERKVRRDLSIMPEIVWFHGSDTVLESYFEKIRSSGERYAAYSGQPPVGTFPSVSLLRQVKAALAAPGLPCLPLVNTSAISESATASTSRRTAERRPSSTSRKSSGLSDPDSIASEDMPSIPRRRNTIIAQPQRDYSLENNTSDHKTSSSPLEALELRESKCISGGLDKSDLVDRHTSSVDSSSSSQVHPSCSGLVVSAQQIPSCTDEPPAVITEAAQENVSASRLMRPESHTNMTVAHNDTSKVHSIFQPQKSHGLKRKVSAPRKPARSHSLASELDEPPSKRKSTRTVRMSALEASSAGQTAEFSHNICHNQPIQPHAIESTSAIADFQNPMPQSGAITSQASITLDGRGVQTAKLSPTIPPLSPTYHFELNRLKASTEDLSQHVQDAVDTLFDGIALQQPGGQVSPVASSEDCNDLQKLFQECWGSDWASVFQKLRDLQLASSNHCLRALVSRFLYDRVFMGALTWQLEMWLGIHDASGPCPLLFAPLPLGFDREQAAHGNCCRAPLLYGLLSPDPEHNKTARNIGFRLMAHDISASDHGSRLIVELASRLSEELINILQPHIDRLITIAKVLHTGTYREHVWRSGFHEELCNVMEAALRLKIDLTRSESKHTFMWPCTGEDLDPSSMKSLHQRGANATQYLVAYTLFPSVQHHGQSGVKNVKHADVVLRARVAADTPQQNGTLTISK